MSVPLSSLATSDKVVLFPLSRVRLLDGPFRRAAEANRVSLLAHDIDRLLAPFRREAGLPAIAEPYGDWESAGLDGHTAGHYLSALASMQAASGDETLRQRLETMVAGLAACQDAGSDGYLGGIPRGRELWEEVARGDIRAGHFDLNGRWVPWYNLHKLLAGLRDAWLVAGNGQAREVFVRLVDWCGGLTANLGDAQMQEMLRCEHGGMNEVLADAAAITGNPRYLALARRFSHREILDPLLRGEDRLTGLHANTQIPKVIGFLRIASLEGDGDGGAAAARFFWETVTRRRTVAFGGNSVAEHFNDPGDFRPMLEHREGPETCNTFNMLRLTEALFRREPSGVLADYYERALFNQILASIHPAEPGYVYFTPIRPTHYRVYSVPQRHFWCCVGSGMENPGRYGQFVYATDAGDRALYVNLFLASELDWTGRGVVVRQETAFPDGEHVRLRFSMPRPERFALHVRHPGWVRAGEFSLRLNGRAFPGEMNPKNGYPTIRRDWQDGDEVEVTVPMHPATERLPDGSDWFAFFHGPVLLAGFSGTEGMTGLRAGEGRSAHKAGGPLVPLDRAPVIVTERTGQEIAGLLRAAPDRSLTFLLDGVRGREGRLGECRLIPFFRLHDSRYQLYWRVTTPERHAALLDRLEREEKSRIEIDATTLDVVRIGEQQSEVDHAFRGEGTTTGENRGRRWRHGRRFSYELETGRDGGDPASRTPVALVITFWGGDDGRVFEVSVNGRVLATECLTAARPGEFFQVRYPVPAALVEAAPGGVLTVAFTAHDGSLAGGVYEVRLVQATSPEP